MEAQTTSLAEAKHPAPRWRCNSGGSEPIGHQLLFELSVSVSYPIMTREGYYCLAPSTHACIPCPICYRGRKSCSFSPHTDTTRGQEARSTYGIATHFCT